MKHVEEIMRFVVNHPGAKFGDIAEGISNSNPKSINGLVRLLVKTGRLQQKGWRGTYSYYPSDTYLASGAQVVFSEESFPSDAITSLQSPELAKFTPRDLLGELKARGYVWDKMYVKHFVEYSKI